MGNPGLTITMIVRDEADNLRELLPGIIEAADDVIVVDTGSADGSADLTRSLGARVFERYLFPFLSARGVTRMPSVVSAENRFFGATVTCSGLLVGRDMVDAIASGNGAQVTFIPPNCLNHDGVTIDEMSLETLAGGFGTPVVAPEASLVEALCEHSGPAQ